MFFNKNYFKMKKETPIFLPVGSLFLLLCSIVLCVTACKKDEVERFCKPSSYDKTNHVYGTMLSTDGSTTWETIIDLTTGLFRAIPASEEPLGGGLDLPLGVRNLTDFEGNRKIYLSGGKLIIQDLTTFDKTIIELTGQGFNVQNPKYLNFGIDKNTVYFLALVDILSVDLTTQEINLVKDDILVDQNQFDDFIYLPESNDFVFFGQKNFTGGVSEKRVSVFDLDTDTVLYTDSIPNLFGFVKHPENDDIFALTIPTTEKKFRLTRLRAMDDFLFISELSSSNLAIDELSPYLQTVHTATNSYVCRGGTNSIDTQNENTLYSINLTNGTLTGEILIEDYETMIGLQGE